MHGGHQVQRGTRCGFKAPLTNTDAKKYTAFTQSFWLVMFQLKVTGNLRPHFVCVCERWKDSVPLCTCQTHTHRARQCTQTQLTQQETAEIVWASPTKNDFLWVSLRPAADKTASPKARLYFYHSVDLSVLMRDNTPDHYSCGLFFHRDKWVPYDRLGKVYLKEVWQAIKVIRRRGRCYLSFNTNGNNSLKIFAIPCGNMLKLFHHYNT